MKSAIQYYYKMTPKNIHQINKKYRFEFQNQNYILYPFEQQVEALKEIYELYLYLNYSGIYCHKIILNSNNEILTIINNNKYILLLTNIDNRKINIKDIEYLSNTIIMKNKYKKIEKKEWHFLWENKIDFIEYQISQFGIKNKIIKESSNYFIGIVENCISLMMNHTNTIKKGISHERINIDSMTEDFYNPINFVIDKRTRDISEYIKSNIKKKNNIFPILENYIKNNNLNENEIATMFIRILYPSVYIDKCENILNKNEKEQGLEKIIRNIEQEERIIKQIYKYLKHTLPEIEWLKKSE